MIQAKHVGIALVWLATGSLGCSSGAGPARLPSEPDGDGDGYGDGDGDGEDGAPDDVGADRPRCVDHDGDGLGQGCTGGPDCDDSDPLRTTGCGNAEFGDPWEPGSADGLVIDEDGRLTLGQNAETDDSVWIANSAENTVSRLDAPSGREIARYPSAITGDNGARPTTERCDMASQGNCPSRTAIDLRRDCWVANRAFGHQGTVTKIAALEEDCVDRNGNGVIDTSRDGNDDGRIDVGEMLGDDDECVLFTVDVGGVDGVPRALAIAPDSRVLWSGGNAWVGVNSERRAYELNGQTGEVLRAIELPLNPYGALAAKLLGVVWFVNAGWQESVFPDNPPSIVAVNFTSGEVGPRREVQSSIGCTGTYGITLDEVGRVWTGGWPCEATFRYDPPADSWLSVDIGGQGITRGLVGAGDGTVWVAHSTLGGQSVGNLTAVDAESGQVRQRFTLPTGIDSIGVDLDREGNIWTVNRETNNATRLDPRTLEFQEFAVGDEPYTYSDFTGHSLRLQFPGGTYTGIAHACEGGEATWLSAQWDGDVPEGAQVELRVRTAASREALSTAAWVGPWHEVPVDFDEPPGPPPAGSYLEFELTLRSLDGISAPQLRVFSVSYFCPIG